MRCDLWIAFFCFFLLWRTRYKITFRRRKPHTACFTLTSFKKFSIHSFCSEFVSLSLSLWPSCFSLPARNQNSNFILSVENSFGFSLCAAWTRQILNSMAYLQLLVSLPLHGWRCFARIECKRNRSTAHARVGCKYARSRHVCVWLPFRTHLLHFRLLRWAFCIHSCPFIIINDSWAFERSNTNNQLI